jgi:hypothetical protein
VAEAWGQFGNPGEEERALLETITRGMVKIQQTEKTQLHERACIVVEALCYKLEGHGF